MGKIWHPLIPTNYSVTAWKFFCNGMPTDDNYQKIAIPTASRCNCCANHKSEDLLHLMLKSDTANYIWDNFAAIFGTPSKSVNIKHFVGVWLEGGNKHSQFAFARIVTLVVSLYYIWHFRNKVLHGECAVNLQAVMQKIKVKTAQIVANFKPKTDDKVLEKIHLEMMNIKVNRVEIGRASWISWTAPPLDCIKMNFDASWHQGEACLGGIFRDWKGNPLAAYHIKCSDVSAVLAEAYSLLFGLCLNEWYKLEGDCQVLISSIQSKNVVDWKIKDTLHKIYMRMGGKSLSYIPREGNATVDSLSKLKTAEDIIYLRNQKRRNEESRDLDALPAIVKSYLALDTLHFPQIRF